MTTEKIAYPGLSLNALEKNILSEQIKRQIITETINDFNEKLELINKRIDNYISDYFLRMKLGELK